ncbi:hypothetical protein C2G38_2217532 [Gigaspora rosea]|uniref:Attractin/MKLN-like beta-propeller domain-containing protein n=1 Tax=Gigaspora rosea TaxID=44941 RepID=A0A397U993_9GLOM|nr:hypothetical protein C2G38_2217532 [Gigaspora rosea]
MGKSVNAPDIIIYSFSYGNCQNIPQPRYGQASVLVNDIFYFFGGANSTNAFNATNVFNDVWYLKLSNSFNATAPQWYLLSSMPVACYWGSACYSGTSKLIYLIGGRMFNPNTNTSNFDISVYQFAPNTSTWTQLIPTRFNNSFKSRNEMQAIATNIYPTIYIFGGPNGDNSNKTYYNDMNRLGYTGTGMKWKTDLSHYSYPFMDYAAVFLPNYGIIIYIGGREFDGAKLNLIEMSKIQIYDANLEMWRNNRSATGEYITPRVGHSAVLAPNGDIIVFGGSKDNNGTFGINLSPLIAVLNTKTWTWSSINATNTPRLTYHSAAIYGNFMIVAFGNYKVLFNFNNSHAINLTKLLRQGNRQKFNTKIYIFDTQNYKWVTSLNQESNQLNQDNSNEKLLKIEIGVGVGGGNGLGKPIFDTF